MGQPSDYNQVKNDLKDTRKRLESLELAFEGLLDHVHAFAIGLESAQTSNLRHLGEALRHAIENEKYS